MSFVVVYLIGARDFVVVPENWVFDLNTAKLKNHGRNSNQDFLVYFINGEKIGEPNFNAPIATNLKDASNGACFLCRVKKFFGR